MEKSELDLAQAREVMAKLRADNNRLETELSEKVGELEAKVTEYKLKFNFAQQQLAAHNAESE